MARVFVTGASGFIGGALADRLLERGDEVVGLARSDEAAAVVAGRGAELARGDLLDEDSIAAGMEGCALAYHVAAINTHCPSDPAMLLRVNVEGTEAAVRAAARAGVPRMVFTSSAASVGERAGTVGREDTMHRGSYLSVYDRSKHLAEQAAFASAQRLGVELVAVNPSSVQGPGRSSGNGKIIIDYLNGRLRVFVDTYISVVDIADTVEGHVHAAARGRSGQRYVLNGATIPSAEALRIVSELSGISEPVAWSRRRWRARQPRSPRVSRAREARLRPSAGHASARSSMATATTARGRLASWDSTTRRSQRRSAAPSTGRWPRGSSPADRVDEPAVRSFMVSRAAEKILEPAHH